MKDSERRFQSFPAYRSLRVSRLLIPGSDRGYLYLNTRARSVGCPNPSRSIGKTATARSRQVLLKSMWPYPRLSRFTP